MTTKNMTYDGGFKAITVVLPNRSLSVTDGDTVEVSADEAKLLSTLPGWKAEKTPKPPTTSEEEK